MYFKWQTMHGIAGGVFSAYAYGLDLISLDNVYIASHFFVPLSRELSFESLFWLRKSFFTYKGIEIVVNRHMNMERKENYSIHFRVCASWCLLMKPVNGSQSFCVRFWPPFRSIVYFYGIWRARAPCILVFSDWKNSIHLKCIFEYDWDSFGMDFQWWSRNSYLDIRWHRIIFFQW